MGNSHSRGHSFTKTDRKAYYRKGSKKTRRYRQNIRSTTRKKNRVFVWNWIWPDDGEFTLGGYQTKLLEARLLPTGESLPFEQNKARLTIKGLPARSPDPVCNVGVVELVFEEEPKHVFASLYPQLHGGDRLLLK